MSNSDDGVVTPHLPPWLRHFKGSFGIPENKKPHRKIFISRDKATTRKLNNSHELLLALKGWESIILEDLPIKEQVKVFAEATHVLATHGAGMVNALWCKEGAKIIELQDGKMLHKKVYPLLSQSLGLKHELFVAKTVPIKINGKKPKGVKRLNDLINFSVDIPKLIRHLD
jgi:capsular polysaccharide biosynthesis protein